MDVLFCNWLISDSKTKRNDVKIQLWKLFSTYNSKPSSGKINEIGAREIIRGANF